MYSSFHKFNDQFWLTIDQLVNSCHIVIDRPKGSAHPRFPELIYPVDYGYLEGAFSGDGQGIDVWRGTADHQIVDAIMCTVDLMKKDSEIKILIGCTTEEKTLIYLLLNAKPFMKGVFIERY